MLEHPGEMKVMNVEPKVTLTMVFTTMSCSCHSLLETCWFQSIKLLFSAQHIQPVFSQTIVENRSVWLVLHVFQPVCPHAVGEFAS